jgi:hypothetical protein
MATRLFFGQQCRWLATSLYSNRSNAFDFVYTKTSATVPTGVGLIASMPRATEDALGRDKWTVIFFEQGDSFDPDWRASFSMTPVLTNKLAKWFDNPLSHSPIKNCPIKNYAN